MTCRKKPVAVEADIRLLLKRRFRPPTAIGRRAGNGESRTATSVSISTIFGTLRQHFQRRRVTGRHIRPAISFPNNLTLVAISRRQLAATINCRCLRVEGRSKSPLAGLSAIGRHRSGEVEVDSVPHGPSFSGSRHHGGGATGDQIAARVRRLSGRGGGRARKGLSTCPLRVDGRGLVGHKNGEQDGGRAIRTKDLRVGLTATRRGRRV